MIRTVSTGLAALLLAAGGTSARAQSLSGAAEAVDGDTLSLSGVLVRLSGIDAVEKGQLCVRNGAEWACGEDAREQLAELVRDRPVDCRGGATDAQGRIVARCTVGQIDLAETMVLSGYAISVPAEAADYSEVEGRARQFTLGIWGAEFEQPHDWRAAHPEAAPQPKKVAAAPAKQRVYRDSFGCAIKGNRSYRGDWIYYLPGQPYYDVTRPEELFCTEAEAQAAGYRATYAR